MPSEMPGRLEPGTPGIPLFAGLLHSLNWQKEHPVPLKEIETLTKALEQGLVEMGAQVIKVENRRTPIVSFCLPGWDLEETGYILDKSFNILCRTGLHCAPLIHSYIGTAPLGSVRFSLSRFTSREEVDYTLEIIEKLMKANEDR
jgi:selenocysteine lyase/cysteine desulfurase